MCMILVVRVVKSSWLSAKIATFLVSIGQLLCLAFLYRWNFLNKISLDWLHTLTTQPSTLKLFDNPGSSFFLVQDAWPALMITLNTAVCVGILKFIHSLIQHKNTRKNWMLYVLCTCKHNLLVFLLGPILLRTCINQELCKYFNLY